MTAEQYLEHNRSETPEFIKSLPELMREFAAHNEALAFQAGYRIGYGERTKDYNPEGRYELYKNKSNGTI